MDLLLCMLRNEKNNDEEDSLFWRSSNEGTHKHKHVFKIKNGEYGKGPMTIMPVAEHSYGWCFTWRNSGKAFLRE